MRSRRRGQPRDASMRLSPVSKFAITRILHGLFAVELFVASSEVSTAKLVD
jgi:hypothetical protein